MLSPPLSRGKRVPASFVARSFVGVCRTDFHYVPRLGGSALRFRLSRWGETENLVSPSRVGRKRNPTLVFFREARKQHGALSKRGAPSTHPSVYSLHHSDNTFARIPHQLYQHVTNGQLFFIQQPPPIVQHSCLRTPQCCCAPRFPAGCLVPAALAAQRKGVCVWGYPWVCGCGCTWPTCYCGYLHMGLIVCVRVLRTGS